MLTARIMVMTSSRKFLIQVPFVYISVYHNMHVHVLFNFTCMLSNCTYNTMYMYIHKNETLYLQQCLSVLDSLPLEMEVVALKETQEMIVVD